jgi:ACS family tartrate transporter-like MFS transporter
MLCSAGLKRYPFLRQIVIELAALMIAFVFPNAVPPILNTLPLSFLRGPAAAAGFALYNTVGLLGGFAGPCILGALKESTGAYTSGMMVLALGMTVSAAIVLALGRAMAPRSVFTRDAKVS